jgi:N-acylneuraminate cytidylyltransferase
MKIAIIPARGGSKRIPRKNIKDFYGKPMIAWSIIAAQRSELFEHIIVSTDDSEIAEIAVQWGAEAPFIRPAELSDDYAGTIQVIAHAIQWALAQGWPVTTVCCIYAAAPFVQIDDLKQGLETLESGDWEYTFPATDFMASVYRSFKRRSDGGVEMLFPEHFSTRSQDLPCVLHDAGQFYWGHTSAWLEQKPIFSRHSTPILIPNWRVQDIDNQNDWIRAELLYKQLEAAKT